jgi:uncharacterized protein YqgC (DUF456 family)
LDYVWAGLLLLACAICWISTLFGLPGNWLILAAAAIYAWLGPDMPTLSLTWQPVAIVAALAVAGEGVELLAGALGAAKKGGSKRGAALALLGSLIGAVVGVFVGIPVPVVGPILSALLFASLGAFCGAMLGEHWKGRELQDSWQIGKAAFWGRLWGTLAKAMFGVAMIAVLVVSLII